MTKLQALKKSIVHWQENLEHAEVGDLDAYDIGSRECALCERYYHCTRDDPSDSLCPLKEYAGDCNHNNNASPWSTVYGLIDQGFNCELIEAVKVMLTTLMFIYQAERGRKKP
jgi:hypothetical protein